MPLIAGLCLGASSVVAGAAATVPDGGIVLSGSGADFERQADLALAAKASWVSLGASWENLEPTPDGYLTPGGPGSDAWAELEQKTSYAKSLGLNVEVTLTDSPSWASGVTGQKNDPPTAANVQAYGDFMADVGRRLGSHIDAYSPWNEVNTSNYWNPVDPVAYVALQKVVYRSLKAVDPSAIVLSATIVGSYDFLRRAYDAGLKGSVDVIGWNGYPSGEPERSYNDPSGLPARSSLGAQRYLRGLIDQYDPGRMVWITEFSWSTCTPTCEGHESNSVDEARQADYLVRAYQYRRRYLSDVTERMFWYQAKDKGTNPTRWTDHHGLLRNDYSPKPSHAAFASLAVESPAAGTPGGGQVPTVAVVPPLPPAAARLAVPAEASSPTARVSLGRPRLTARRGVLTLTIRIRVSGGRTRVLVEGYRARRWRAVTSIPTSRSGTLTLRFPDTGYQGIRVRATLPGHRGWRVGRIVKITATTFRKG